MLAYAFFNAFRYQILQLPAKGCQLAHTGGADEGIFGIGHNKNRFQIIIDFFQKQRSLEFIFEIGKSTQASDDKRSIFLFAEFVQQSGKTGYSYIRNMLQYDPW